jgi:hypothetical protein
MAWKSKFPRKNDHPGTEYRRDHFTNMGRYRSACKRTKTTETVLSASSRPTPFWLAPLMQSAQIRSRLVALAFSVFVKSRLEWARRWAFYAD